MAPPSKDYVMLLATDRSWQVPEIERLLSADAIPYHLGIMPGPPARAVFTVPRQRLDEARVAIASELAVSLAVVEGDDEPDPVPPPKPETPTRFPWGPFWRVAGVAWVHLLILGAIESPLLRRSTVFALFGLRPELTALEPWRMVTSMFLHADIGHALRNALPMMVFAMALAHDLGLRRTALIYAISGIGGGLAATAFTDYGTTVIGSSGAVAGLFGGWLATRLRNLAHTGGDRRDWLRVAGVGLLVIPSFVNPVGADGGRISVSSHVGGLVAGIVIGALLAGALLSRRGKPDELGPTGDKDPTDDAAISFRRKD